jgi:hypothetical protein
MRQAFVENLLRACLAADTMRWPRIPSTRTRARALRLLEQPGERAGPAEVAVALYDIAAAILNIVAPISDGKFDWAYRRGHVRSSRACPAADGGDGPNQEDGVQEPASAGVPGDFKPELQLLARLKNQTEGDGAMTPLTKEQIMEC